MTGWLSKGWMASIVVVLVVASAWVSAPARPSAREGASAGPLQVSASPIVFLGEMPANNSLHGLLDPITVVAVAYADLVPSTRIVAVDFHLDGMNLTSAGFFNNTAFTMPVGFAFRDGPHLAAFVLRDNVGTVAFHNWTFTVDTIPPVLVLTSPAYPIVSTTTVLVAGTAKAALLQAAPVTVAVTVLPSLASREMEANLTTGAFDLIVPVAEGPNLLTVQATDAAGNPTVQTLTVLRDTTPPVVSVSLPPDGLETNASTVVLRGTVSDANATVLVDGQMIRPDAAGRWAATVALVPGANTVMVSAVDVAGNRAAPVIVHIAYFSPIPGLQNGTSADQVRIDELGAVLRFSILGIVLLFTAVTLLLYSRVARRIREQRRVIAALVRTLRRKT